MIWVSSSEAADGPLVGSVPSPHSKGKFRLISTLFPFLRVCPAFTPEGLTHGTTTSFEPHRNSDNISSDSHLRHRLSNIRSVAVMAVRSFGWTPEVTTILGWLISPPR